MPFARPLKLYVPFAAAVVVAPGVPLKVTVAPLVSDAGLNVPDSVHVWTVAVKLTAVFELPLIVMFWLVGLKLTPVFVGVIV